jgi:hypothetical protein
MKHSYLVFDLILYTNLREKKNKEYFIILIWFNIFKSIRLYIYIIIYKNIKIFLKKWRIKEFHQYH